MPHHLPDLGGEHLRDRPCIADERITLTYGELDERVSAFATQLLGYGICPGDIIAVMLPNRAEFVIALFAAWRCGAAVTPVNPVLTEHEAGHQLRDSGARLIVTAEPERFAGFLHVVDVDHMRTQTHGAGADHRVPEADDLALVVYTSGSTGAPKGVMLDHGNLEAMTGQMIEHFEADDSDHCILVLPLFHVNAMLVSVLTPLRAGARTTLVERFEPAAFLDRIAEVRPTYFSCVPTILAGITGLPLESRPDTSSLRLAICGAAPASAPLLARAESELGVAVVEGYGLTEATCASACNPVRGERRLGTVGPALPGQRIVIAGDDGEPAAVGERGEVLISGPTVMRGYLGNPEATARTVVDGWLHTGDIGTLDEDGYLRIVDRLKDMIIRGGENIYPKEIETVILGIPGVLEAAVVGRPDERLGEVPVALVSLYPDSPLDADGILAVCRERLTKIKVPVSIDIVPEIPKNPVGKIDKPALRAGALVSPPAS